MLMYVCMCMCVCVCVHRLLRQAQSLSEGGEDVPLSLVKAMQESMFRARVMRAAEANAMVSHVETYACLHTHTHCCTLHVCSLHRFWLAPLQAAFCMLGNESLIAEHARVLSLCVCVHVHAILQAAFWVFGNESHTEEDEDDYEYENESDEEEEKSDESDDEGEECETSDEGNEDGNESEGESEGKEGHM